jgi:transposase-like protein
VSDLLEKLHKNYLNQQERKAPEPSAAVEAPPQRKPNFFDRKRFVDYERNEDSDNEKSKEKLPEPARAVVETKVEEVQPVKQASPPKKQEDPVDDWDQEEKQKEKSASQKSDEDYEDNWDMSDHDLQDNTEKSKAKTAAAAPAEAPKPVVGVTNVMFDEIPTIKDASPEEPKHKVEEQKPSIDFFGVQEESPEPIKNQDIMFEDLEKEYANDKSAAPFGQSINKEIL